MAENKYPINEDDLREKFLTYSVPFDISQVTHLENEIDQIRTHAPIDLPSKKKLLLVFLTLVGACVVGGILFLMLQKTPEDTPKKNDTSVKVTETKPPIENLTPPAPQTKTIVVDTIKPEAKKADSATIPTKIIEKKTVEGKSNKKVEQKNNVLKNNNRDTTAKSKPLSDTANKIIKQSADSAKNTEATPSKKKKRKRKNILDATQEIRDAAPNSADDDVVVPNN
ncbi:MAG: hypothetical protein JST67_11550 [Bacteroidetes bacterium]|nr:hypothetical protein [Bacteroidota bacterium]